MTHPDDEISICAWINRLVENGNEVFMSWTHSNPKREKEGRKAAALIGVPGDHLRFFGAPDGDVVDHINPLIEEFRAWFGVVRPDRVCCGAFEQGHIDHDATNFIVNQAFQGAVFEIPFYHTYLVRLQKINRFADPRGEEVRHLDLQEQEFKKRVAKQYPSTNIWSVLFCYEVLQGSRLKRADLAKSERMRQQSHRDFLVPNLPPTLAKQVKRCEKWKRWERVMREINGSRPA